MSNHGIVDTRSSIAFSWEDSPGVSKYFMGRQNFSSSNYHFNGEKIPPPPCAAFRSPIIGKSSSMRGSSRTDDPFIAALIECTKSINTGNSKRPPTDHYEPIRKNNDGSSKGLKKSSYFCIFSCKEASSEVKVGNIVRLSNLPPLPRPRRRSYRPLKRADED
ncbi:hypothetical protein FXO38_22948 [Capsicum annuum]|nr:hypothetical protein FXO38_22948 [Capsicum annuum]KAF3640086.1 hypothetical protein FXO37_23682 [Capsicum annuum]